MMYIYMIKHIKIDIKFGNNFDDRFQNTLKNILFLKNVFTEVKIDILYLTRNFNEYLENFMWQIIKMEIR